jgi:ABC-type glycerol-3-phosphate transport system substrate-binding protein
MKPVFALAAILALAACGGGQSPAENTAENLEEAAEQSTPEAADVLENAADRIEDQNITDPAAAQNALQEAGNAQGGNSH